MWNLDDSCLQEPVSDTSAWLCTSFVSSAISGLRLKKWCPKRWMFCPMLMIPPCPSISYTCSARSISFQAASLVWAMMNWRVHRVSCHRIAPWPYKRGHRNETDSPLHLDFCVWWLGPLFHISQPGPLFPSLHAQPLLPHFSSKRNPKPPGLVWSVPYCKIFLLTLVPEVSCSLHPFLTPPHVWVCTLSLPVPKLLFDLFLTLLCFCLF